MLQINHGIQIYWNICPIQLGCRSRKTMLMTHWSRIAEPLNDVAYPQTGFLRCLKFQGPPHLSTAVRLTYRSSNPCWLLRLEEDGEFHNNPRGDCTSVTGSGVVRPFATWGRPRVCCPSPCIHKQRLPTPKEVKTKNVAPQKRKNWGRSPTKFSIHLVVCLAYKEYDTHIIVAIYTKQLEILQGFNRPDFPINVNRTPRKCLYTLHKRYFREEQKKCQSWTLPLN